MGKLARDIKRTLLIKAILLFALWFVCFHGVKRMKVDGPSWLFSTKQLPKNEVNYHDSRH